MKKFKINKAREEIKLTHRIQSMIEREFPKSYVQRASDKFLSGIPDLRVISYGLSGDIEVKWTGEKPTPIQRKVLQYITEAGGAKAVVYSVEEARIFMHRLQREGLEYQNWRALQ